MGDYPTLTNSWAGWDYYSDGTVVGPDGTYYSGGNAVWSPPTATPAASGGSWSDGWAGTLQGIANVAANTWSAKTLMQQNQQGQRYLEGQPIMLGQPGNNMGGLVMLAGLGLLVYALVK